MHRRYGHSDGNVEAMEALRLSALGNPSDAQIRGMMGAQPHYDPAQIAAKPRPLSEMWRDEKTRADALEARVWELKRVPRWVRRLFGAE